MHIFIPIVAVGFIVLVIFVCGTSGRDKQPDPAYLTKLNELDVQQRRERKPPRPAAASKPLPVSRPAQSTTESSTNTVRVSVLSRSSVAQFYIFFLEGKLVEGGFLRLQAFGNSGNRVNELAGSGGSPGG